MKLNPLTLVEDLINEHGSSKILRERLLLLKDELGKSEKERAELQTKATRLEKENAQLKRQLQQREIPDQFTEHMGALFKRDTSGKYESLAYCLKCKRPLWNNEPSVFPYECSTPGCGYTIMINEPLAKIAERLNNAS